MVLDGNFIGKYTYSEEMKIDIWRFYEPISMSARS